MASLVRRFAVLLVGLRRGERLVLSMCAVFLGACTSLPDVPRAASVAIPASSDTNLGRIAKHSAPAGQSAARLLHTGDVALDARLALIGHAVRSVDAQYYQVAGDDTGRRFLQALQDAAARGARVRLLVDDLYTGATTAALLRLARQPGAEVRLFNPFSGWRGGPLLRLLGSGHDFDRVNRRMHNKLLVADGAFAITGGRNIADEYFARSLAQVFFDFDLLVSGTAVASMASVFDAYWNSPTSYPLSGVVAAAPATTPPDEAATLAAMAPVEPDDLGGGAVSVELDRGLVTLMPADIVVLADTPEKAAGGVGVIGDVGESDHSSLHRFVTTRMVQTQRRLTIIGPYNIPGEAGMQRMRQARARGVEIEMLTNSLLSTDEVLVYAAYRRYRLDMLRIGVHLHELSATQGRGLLRRVVRGQPVLRLHTKCAVFDDDSFFIGSLNFDPRSREHNTEMGLMVSSQALVRQVRFLVQQLRDEAAYRVVQTDDGLDVQWLVRQPDGSEQPRAAPAVGLWRRLWLELLARMVPEGLL